MSKNHQSVKLGFLYPGFAAEDDFPQIGQMVTPRVDVELVHTTFIEDAHTVEALSEMGSVKRINEGTKELAGKNLDAVLWTSTSASFVLGLEGIKEQVAAMESALKVPASTTALAFIHAAQTLNAKRVAIAATYPEDIAVIFKNFLESFQIEVVQYASKNIITAAEVGTLQKEEVLQFAADNSRSDIDALLIPDTALHSVQWLEDIETAIQRPVITANQASFWEALRLTGRFTPQKGLGTLFTLKPLEPGGHTGDFKS
ncbi:maleate cis-trans isomerase family protein [Salipaludibacillus aurantiacus]|uniref:Maleate cis-trans isomerase n=1 Tax=Salipaludibacillus aurantiacus TaxID=1601833 RepID=A0A1H9Q8U8_9BACI|nr:maleate cis-trans isomerase [Salipaludibacillus aurantiacus]SER56921.1 Maleate cis-trans isomerase [Salipaludibacillus aurantiacus]